MEISPNEPVEHEGDKFLRLLGLSDLAKEPLDYKGQVMQVRDFLDICGEHARPMLMGFEALNHDDPRYEPAKYALQNYIRQFVVHKPADS